MTQARRLFLLLFCLAIGQVLIAQTTYNSIANGDWNVSTTWDANGIPPNPIPAGDVVNLNHRVTVQFSTTVTNNGSVLVPLEGAPVNSSTAAGLTVRGTFNNNNEITVGPYTATVVNFVISVSGEMNNTGNIIVNADPNGPNGRTRYGGKLNNLPGGLVEGHDVLQFSTEVNNAQGATIRKFAGFTQGGMFSGTFTNEGLFEQLGTFLTGGSFNIRNGGVLLNNPTGVINNGGRLDAGFFGGTITNLGTINNTNTLAATPFSGVGVINSTNGTINNDGVIYETDAGELNFSASTLSGSGGVFGGRFLFSIQSGSTQPGTTTINGPLINSGKVIVKINGTAAGDFSVIEVLGQANLTGTTLEGFRNNSYSPTVGDQFEILTATGGVTGTFTATDLTDIGPNLDWEVVYEANRVLLKVVDATACEPTAITCPGNISVGNDNGDCGAIVTFTLPDGATATPPSGSFFPVGTTTVDVEGDDGCGGTSICSFTVTVNDTEDPTAVCKDVTVDFNGESSIDLAVSQVWNEAASSDNCGNVHYVSTSPSLSISCADLGSVVPLTVTIRDDKGNTGNCTANVTVTGLPCGWSEGPQDGSLNCGDATSVNYDTNDESFTLTADGCFHDCREPDQAVYAFQQLCGDGELVARLASISSGGYAGLMARESLDPLSRRVGAMKNQSTRTIRREYRTTYGGIVSQLHTSRRNVKWFKIVRQGNQIKSYTSSNGSYWRLLYKATVPGLNDCIYLGMTAYSNNINSEVTAVFKDVQITSYNSNLVAAPNQWQKLEEAATDHLLEGQLNIFPNPATDQAQIVLAGFEDKPAQIVIRDQFGRVVRQIEVDAAGAASETWQLGKLASGIYMVSVIQDQQLVVSKRLVVQR